MFAGEVNLFQKKKTKFKEKNAVGNIGYQGMKQSRMFSVCSFCLQTVHGLEINISTL